MNSIDFCYWLQGYFEVSKAEDLTPEQTEIVKSHLDLVFKHEIDPLRESETDTPAAELNAAHYSGIAHAPNDPLIRC